MGKKITLFPDDNVQKGPHDFTDDIQFPLLFVIMMPNTIGTIAKAIRHNDYSLAVFAISVIPRGLYEGADEAIVISVYECAVNAPVNKETTRTSLCFGVARYSLGTSAYLIPGTGHSQLLYCNPLRIQMTVSDVGRPSFLATFEYRLEFMAPFGLFVALLGLE
ncbi:hypothetical protein Tco_1464890 [Tanacetum coccineum]